MGRRDRQPGDSFFKVRRVKEGLSEQETWQPLPPPTPPLPLRAPVTLFDGSAI